MTRTVLRGGAVLNPVAGEVREADLAMEDGRLEELVLMHQLGMDAARVWRACTSDAARLLDRPDLGVLDAGRRADVVAVEGGPWSFDELDSRIRHVWKDGVAV